MPKTPQQLNFCKLLKLIAVDCGSMSTDQPKHTRARAYRVCVCDIKENDIKHSYG